MGTAFRWTGMADQERVVETRLRCYGRAGRDRDQFGKRLTDDPRSKDGDFLLAEETRPGGAGAEAVGTLTSLSLSMWMRGSRFACQGIAWVGTVRTHRRQGGNKSAQRGVASQLMDAALAKARERGEIISALMPFRASFYQHFGYGIVEQRNAWTVPLSILPTGSNSALRYATMKDMPAMASLFQRIVERGQCNIERGEARWRQAVQSVLDEGFLMVDPDPDGKAIRGYLALSWQHQEGKDVIDAVATAYEDVAALGRQLAFLASQRDQFSNAKIMLPVDLPLNWLLREGQIAHRPVNHAAATVAPQTRMQIRVLDHVKLLENLHLPARATGKASVCIKESEGHDSRFIVDLHEGRIGVKSGSAATGGASFTCADHTWASIVSGTLRASTARQLGLAESDAADAATLDHLASPEAGPLPFNDEYF